MDRAMTGRRRFLAQASSATSAVAIAALTDAPSVIAQPRVRWRMSTAWTPALDHPQGAAQRLAKVVDEMSSGRFRIEVFPGGQIMPPFDCFEAASRGTFEAFMGAAYPGWHEPGTTLEFGFNKKAYDALPADLRRTLDHAAAVQVYGLTDFHLKNAIALERLKAEFKGKVEVLALSAPVLRDLKKLAVEVVGEQPEKTPMARKVHTSFTKFQTLVGPWDHVAEGASHQLVTGQGSGTTCLTEAYA